MFRFESEAAKTYGGAAPILWPGPRVYSRDDFQVEAK